MMFSDRTMFTQQASPLAASVGGGREPMSMPMPSSMYGGGMSMGGGFNPYMMGGGYGSPFMGGMPSTYMMGGGFPQMPQMPPQQPPPQQSMQGGYPPMMGGFPPMMGGFGGFNPYMMGGGMMGGFPPMMGGFGGFNPYMMGGGMMGGGFGFNPMPYGGYQSHQPMQQQFPGNAYTGPPPPMAPPSPPPPIGAPVHNPYSNIMPSQPLEPPNQPSFDSRQRNMALQQLASREGWSAPIYTAQYLGEEAENARAARDAEAAANFLKEKGVQYDDSRLQDLYQSLFGQQSNNVPAAPSVPAFALPSIQRGSGRDQFSIDPYDQQQAQMAAMRRISPSPYMSMGGIGSLFGGGGRPAPPMGGQVLQPMRGISLSSDDPMFGMPSAPPAMSPDTARIPGGLEAYDQQVKNWEQQTGMKAGDWYKKRDEAVEWRNKQAANAPASPPPVAAQAQTQVSNFGSPYLSMGGLGSFFGGGSQPSPAPNRYSNIMPSQPLQPPNQPVQPFAMPTGGRGQSSINPYSQQQAQLLAMQQQPRVETDEEFNQRAAKEESDYYANMERLFGKERADEIRRISGPINFADVLATTRVSTGNRGGIG